MTAKTAVQIVEECKKRIELLQTRRTRAQTILEAERAKLDEALAEGLVEYDADGLEALQAVLEQRETENMAKAVALAAALDLAERQLAPVEAVIAG